MTIAEWVSLERTDEIIHELESLELKGTFICDSLAYAVPDNEMQFTERATIKLKS